MEKIIERDSEKIREELANINERFVSRTNDDLTVNELKTICELLIKKGYGDREIWVGYDTHICCTGISGFEKIHPNENAIIFYGE